MDNPLFSLIVPVYNVELYLDTCIKSILEQTYQDFELILVDDGSKDSSARICDEYALKDARIQVIHNPNAGVSAARNTGLDIAKGKYVCFVDSDDWIDNRYLQTVIDNISNFDILFISSVWHYEDGSIRSLCMKTSECHNGIGDAIFHLLDNETHINYFGFTWNKVFCKDIIDQFHLRFIEGLAISEDEVFTLAYCNHIKTLKIIDIPLYHYLWKKQGLTHKHRMADEWILLADNFKILLSQLENDELRAYYQKRIATIYNIAAWASISPFKWIKEELRMIKYCKFNHVSLPVKSIGREFINKFI